MLRRLFVLGALGFGLMSCLSNEAELGDRVINVDTGATPAAATLSTAMEGLVAEANPSYVTLIISDSKNKIRADSKKPVPVTAGSGFVVDPQGYVLTAGHVAMQKGFTVSARGPDGRIYSGRVVDVRPGYDMALVKLSGFEGAAVRPSQSACLKPGDPIFSLGKPHAQGDTARFGQVEAMSFGRAVAYQGFGYPDAMVLKMDTKKGESGGPVFNEKGELVGMVVSTLSDGNGRPLNLAHAVPLPALAQFMCSEMNCTPQWTSLVSQETHSCPQS
ncbi:MAG TPA: serine protease [Aestuariivirgaceae bacterium]